MKKNFLAVIIIIAATASSAFGFYGFDNAWIDLLTTRNQVRVRANQLGIQFGSENFIGVVGFKSQGPNAGGGFGDLGKIFQGQSGGDSGNSNSFMPTATVAFGYKSAPFGIAVGYSFTYLNPHLMVHTPALAMDFMNDNIRLAIPLQVVKTKNDGRGRDDYFGISSDAQLRIYTGWDPLNHIRLYTRVGYNNFKIANNEYSASSVGLELRFYMLKHDLGTLNVSPLIKVVYNGVFGVKDKIGNGQDKSASYTFIQSFNGVGYRDLMSGETSINDQDPYQFRIAPAIGLTAASDIVEFYIEPTLGYQLNATSIKSEGLYHDVFWELYSETYVRPTPDIVIYAEAYIGNQNGSYTGGGIPFTLAANLGINWFVPWVNIGQ